MVKNNNECCGFELKAKPRLGQPRSVKIRKTALRYGVDDHGTRNTMPPLTRDFAGNDAPGKVIIASRDGVIRPGLFLTVHIDKMEIFE